MQFATYENNINGIIEEKYGFVSEIEITEDMCALDIHQMIMDLKEKYPELTGWVNETFMKEQEVLILAEYVPEGNILNFDEANKIKETLKEE